MSQRNIRKVFGGMQLPPPDGSSDDEYQPSYAQNYKKSIYAGLEVSSGSEDNVSEKSEEDIPEEPKPEPVKKRKNKKKKKQPKVVEEEDEIEGIVKEINAALGVPEQPPPVDPIKDLESMRKHLFTVRQQYFNVEQEMNKLFGPDDEDEPKKRGRQPNLRIIAQKGYIIQSDAVYKKSGLTMILKERKDDGCSYFIFQHNKAYQSLHSTFIQADKQNWGGTEILLQESQRMMHVEGLLELADRLYTMEEYTRGNKVIEEVIHYMQYCGHYYFSVTNLNTRLEYKHMENRAFHIALLKYMHMLTNKACHRTALEIAKLLLNLDPSDPLAVLFIIDTIAIRARMYQWLVHAIDYWNEDRDAGFLFNMQYSYAMAHYHIARQNKESLEKADELLQKAMLKFPTVVTNIMQIAGVRNAKIKDCALFNIDANNKMSTNLKDLIYLYSRLIWNKFCEDAVMKWLTRNAAALVDKYETDDATKEEARKHANVRMNLFQIYPSEIVRHLSILTPLNTLIADGAVPKISNVVSYDPAPPFDGVNMYERSGGTSEEGVNYFEIFTSILPDHELQDGSMEIGRDQPVARLSLREDQNPEENENGNDETDRESELDSDDTDNPLANAIQFHGPDARIVHGQNDAMFIRLPILNVQQPNANSDDEMSTDDENMAEVAANFLQAQGQGPIIVASNRALSDSEMDSDDDSDPIIATFTIRSTGQFYRDLCETFASNDSMEVAEPIHFSPAIDVARVRRGDFPDDLSYRENNDGNDNCCASCSRQNAGDEARGNEETEYETETESEEEMEGSEEPKPSQEEPIPQILLRFSFGDDTGGDDEYTGGDEGDSGGPADYDGKRSDGGNNRADDGNNRADDGNNRADDGNNRADDGDDEDEDEDV